MTSSSGASRRVEVLDPVDRRTRAGRSKSIRYRMLAPIAVATVGLGALGGVQTQAAGEAANGAARAAVLAQVATATVRLSHQVEQEIGETDALLDRGGKTGTSLLTAQRSRTDLALDRYLVLTREARQWAPALDPLLDDAQRQIDKLRGLRETAMHPVANGNGPEDVYDGLSRSLVAVLDALPNQLADPTLASSARALANLAAAEHLHSKERELLRSAYQVGAFRPGELRALAALDGAARERMDQFELVAAPALRDRFDARVSGPDVDTAQDLLHQALVAGDQATGRPATLDEDPDAWYIAQSNLLRRLYLAELDVANRLGADARHLQDAATVRAVVTGLATVIVVLVAFFGAVLLAVRISRRLGRLRRDSFAVAAGELPETVSAVSSATDPGSVRSLVGAAVKRAEMMRPDDRDEIGQVAYALNAVHRQALRLAADQAMLRLDVSQLFVTLSRRGQTLIQRQINLIDDFERSETDPKRLERLFALDHLAARMRRNEENLLVIAGGEPGRRFTQPVPLYDVIRAAAAEIEDYSRVDGAAIADVSVAAPVVGDLVHLLAELLENAAVFSPPTSRICVTARESVGELTVSIFDEGIGIPAEQLDEINRRFADPGQLTSDLARTMGLLVVGRLAARHGIRVQLRSSQGGGTVALVQLAPALLAPREVAADRGLQAPVEVTWQVPDHRTQTPAAIGSGLDQRPVRDAVSQLADESVRPTRLTIDGEVSELVGAGAATTGAGLPRRRPGGVEPRGAGGARSASTPDGAPDPEVVRARLSGLAGGIAAAQQQIRAPRQRS
jgi:signal transduction histidine kinase